MLHELLLTFVEILFPSLEKRDFERDILETNSLDGCWTVGGGCVSGLLIMGVLAGGNARANPPSIRGLQTTRQSSIPASLVLLLEGLLGTVLFGPVAFWAFE